MREWRPGGLKRSIRFPEADPYITVYATVIDERRGGQLKE
jgi:hypothetical protein